MEWCSLVIKSVFNTIWRNIEGIFQSWSVFSDVLTAFGTLVLVILALIGFNAWKQQISMQRKATFIDELLHTIYEYIDAMGGPVQSVRFIKYGFEAYSDTEKLRQNNNKHAGIITYIKKNGENDSKRLFERLRNVRPFKSRLHFLIIKGGLFKFEDYSTCATACRSLTSSYDQIEALAAMISSPLMNWENPKVKEMLDKLALLDALNIENNLSTNLEILIKFIESIYGKLFK